MVLTGIQHALCGAALFQRCGRIRTTGEDHQPETHLLPLVLQVARGKRPSVTIHGDDIRRRMERAFATTSRKDLATAHISALEYLAARGESDVFNLATVPAHPSNR